jgi:hypothetical protein
MDPIIKINRSVPVMRKETKIILAIKPHKTPMAKNQPLVLILI